MKHFLSGHTIYLRMPTLDDVTEDGWSNWYNDQEITKYNSHGIFPISLTDELTFVQEALNNPKTILLAICNIKDDAVIGNIALQSINWLNRSCQLGITMGDIASMTSGIEAYGLMTSHAFKRLNLNRISEATHENLESFVHMASIFGYQIEGRGREHFIRENKKSDSIIFSCLAADFFQILEHRNNTLLFNDLTELKQKIVDAVREKQALPK